MRLKTRYKLVSWIYGCDLERAEKVWYDLGAHRKEQQIIKLLEDNCECDLDSRCCGHDHIALIKGENK